MQLQPDIDCGAIKEMISERDNDNSYDMGVYIGNCGSHCTERDITKVEDGSAERDVSKTSSS